MSLNRDLTVGKPGKVLLRFCLPLFASIIFQQLYNIADSFVAGKFIGNDALAAVGNSYEITLIFIAFAFGCNIGCSVIAAQLFGAKKFSDLKTLVYTVLISSGVLCVVLMACGFLFGGALLMTVLMLLWNYLITPLYMHTARADVAAMLVPVFLPFNLLKGCLNATITVLLYKPVVQGLRHAHLLPPSKTPGRMPVKRRLAVCIVLILILHGTI